MSGEFNRRQFVKTSAAASAGAILGLSLEEQVLAAHQSKKSKKARVCSVKDMPAGKIGGLKVSRLICGGNLISGHAHSRDLTYVSSLLRHYFTDEKVLETFRICEENGINSAVLRLDDHCIRIINKYWKDFGGKLLWIAQVKPKQNDLTTDAKRAIDNGAKAVYIQGSVADTFVKNGRVELIGKVVEFIKEQGIVAGVGGHSIDVPIAVDTAGIGADFFMKTLHSGNYWSARRPEQHQDVVSNSADNYWSMTPEQTIRFMREMTKPWLAYKVLAAGAIHPREGFKFAFENGADFIVAGMFDFQVEEDANIAKEILAKLAITQRKRPWRG
jgi:hypothetical protein